MGAVVVLMTLLVTLLSGLTAGLGRESTSGIADLPADHLAFSSPGDGQDVSFADSAVTAEQQRAWARAPGVAAEPLAITTTKASVGTGEGARSATVLALTTTDDADLAAADERAGTTTLTTSGSLSAIGSYTSENGSLQLMRAMLFGISALVIGTFFTVWTIQRSGDIAVLKALGATTRYLMKDAIGQALALLLAGTALGAGRCPPPPCSLRQS